MILFNNIEQNDNINLNNLEKYMLYDNFINKQDINKQDINKKDINKQDINKEKLSTIFKDFNKEINTKTNKKSNKESNILFIPQNNDKLFWCFYILKNGINDYNLNINNTFSIEKKIKIDAIKYIKSNKLNFKIKKTAVENNLLYEKTLSIQSLNLLCNIYNLNIRLINLNFYYEFLNNENSEFLNIYKENYNYGIDFQNKNNDISNKLLITNYEKPINSISFYKLDEIINLANKLKIELYNNNNKNKIKKELYDEIYNILNNS